MLSREVLKEVIVVTKRKRIQKEHDLSRNKQSTQHEMNDLSLPRCFRLLFYI